MAIDKGKAGGCAKGEVSEKLSRLDIEHKF